MAKLSAHGRKELVRLVKEYNNPKEKVCSLCKNESDKVSSCIYCKGTGMEENRCLWTRTSVALMSDGRILEKLDVKFRLMPYENSPNNHSYGWKIKARIKPDISTEQFVAMYIKAGYVRCS